MTSVAGELRGSAKQASASAKSNSRKRPVPVLSLYPFMRSGAVPSRIHIRLRAHLRYGSPDPYWQRNQHPRPVMIGRIPGRHPATPTTRRDLDDRDQVQYRISRVMPQLSPPGGTRGLPHQCGGSSLDRVNDQAGLRVLIGDRTVHGRRRDRRTENPDPDAALQRLMQVRCWRMASGASEPTAKETCHGPARTSLVDISLEIPPLLYR
jgi:hypothetical protein